MDMRFCVFNGLVCQKIIYYSGIRGFSEAYCLVVVLELECKNIYI